jgi:hypothetical protein
VLDPLEPVLPDPLVEPLVPEPPLADEPLLLCFFLVLVLEVLPVPAEPLDPELLLSIPLPLEPEPLVPVEPVVPPLDWAKAAPAASIEITARRFHHVFCIRKRSR